MNQKDKDYILVYGDTFVDFIANDFTNTSFTTFLGGATINVASGISRIGAPSSLITIIGEDDTSNFVRSELEKEGVILDYAILAPEKRVCGVYVHLKENGERMFKDYVDETPDIQVTPEQLNEKAFKRASIFSICSGTMFHPTALSTTRKGVKLAKGNDTIISIDANIRPLRWSSIEHCRKIITSFFQDVHILKLTDDELLFLTETDSLEEGLSKLNQYQIPMILVTVGANGAYGILNGDVIHVPTEKIEPVDTTGAGDAFMAGVLRYVHFKGLPTTLDELHQVLHFGNKLGALAATKVGALTALPHYHQIKDFI